MDLAAADQSRAAALQLLCGREPARLRAAAAGPRFRSLPGRRRVLRPPAEPVGRAEAGTGGGWGKGSVQLVEIPTVDETFDNIVAFWNPAEKPERRAGNAVRLPHVLGHAHAVTPRRSRRPSPRAPASAAPWARSASTIPGISPSISPAANLGALAKDAAVEAVITASHGPDRARHRALRRGIHGYRALFDIKPRRTASIPSICACTCASTAGR